MVPTAGLQSCDAGCCAAPPPGGTPHHNKNKDHPPAFPFGATLRLKLLRGARLRVRRRALLRRRRGGGGAGGVLRLRRRRLRRRAGDGELVQGGGLGGLRQPDSAGVGGGGGFTEVAGIPLELKRNVMLLKILKPPAHFVRKGKGGCSISFVPGFCVGK